MASPNADSELGDPQGGIVAAAVALDRIRQVLALGGTALAWGVGGAIFAVAMIRMPFLPEWLGWLGLVVAVMTWLTALQLAYRPLEKLFLPFLLVGIIWLAAVGVTLVRFDPDPVPLVGQDMLLADLTFVHLAGVIVLAAIGLVALSLVISIQRGLPEPTPDPTEMDSWLADVGEQAATYRVTSWMLVVDHLLEVAVLVALFAVFADGGVIMFLGLLIGTTGLVLVAVSGMVQLGLADLATRDQAVTGSA